VLPIERPLDVTRTDERRTFVELSERYRAVGATVLNLRVRHRSLDHLLEQLAVVARDVAPAVA
jgi:hypothetical protein